MVSPLLMGREAMRPLEERETAVLARSMPAVELSQSSRISRCLVKVVAVGVGEDLQYSVFGRCSCFIWLFEVGDIDA